MPDMSANTMSSAVDNLLSNMPKTLPQEFVETLLSHQSLRIERIISKGHKSADGFWYDQEQHEWVVLIQGQARLQFNDGRILTMKAGDYVNIPAHCKHRVEWTTPATETIWLAVFY